MTAVEKRYFKNFALGNSSDTDPKYLQVFDILSRQTVFNENALLKATDNVDNPNRLAVIKNCLNRNQYK